MPPLLGTIEHRGATIGMPSTTMGDQSRGALDGIVRYGLIKLSPDSTLSFSIHVVETATASLA